MTRTTTIKNAADNERSNADLPEGWCTARLDELFDCWGGMTPSTSESSFWNGNIPWISSKDVKDWRISSGTEYVTKKALQDTNLRLCPVGSVLVVVRSGILAHTLPITITDADVVINQDLKAFYCAERCLDEWLALGLRAMAPEILRKNRKDGTTVQSIRYEQLKKLELRIPPLAEQKRIVERVEALLSRVNAARDRLSKVPAILKRFRQSVLEAACSGRLTEDWREDNPDVPNASLLLQEVKAQRLLSHQKECMDAKKRGQIVPDYEWVDNNNPDFSMYNLSDLPDTWIWSHVSRFGYVKGGKRLPKGSSLVKENTGHPYLRISDLNNGTVDPSDILYVPLNVLPIIRKYTIHHGDVYLTIVGSIGEAGTIPPEFDNANLTENAAKIVQPNGINPVYLVSWFRSTACQEVIQKNIHSAGQGKLALFRIEKMPVPLAPLAEQKEIVHRVENIFMLADNIEKRVAIATARAEKLTQAVLAKAFRGELVPTEAELARREGREYEPADSLLERIHGGAPTISGKEKSSHHHLDRKAPR